MNPKESGFTPEQYSRQETRDYRLEASRLAEKIRSFDFSELERRLLSPKEVESLAVALKELPGYTFVLENLASIIPEKPPIFDWNCGNIFAHFDGRVLSKIVKTLDRRILSESAGLSWAVGEVDSRDSVLIQFLRDSVEGAVNSDSWWNAAFSLEKLDQEQAVPYLKMSLKAKNTDNQLSDYLSLLGDKKSVIGVLSLADAVNTKEEIFPSVKTQLLTSENPRILGNAAWLIGRFRFFDEEIFQRLETLLETADGELQKNILFAIQENASPRAKQLLLKMLRHNNPQFRESGVIALTTLAEFDTLRIFEKMLYVEDNSNVIAALTNAIYKLKNPINRSSAQLLKTYPWKENGMIRDDSDKWYGDPDIYNVFSECEDPENVCFSLIQRLIGDRQIRNPIDLASGTGRMAWQILSKVNFDGQIICADASKHMCDFLEKRIMRDSGSLEKLRVENARIDELPERIGEGVSDFIVSSFGFPSRIFNKEQVIKDLQAVEKILTDDGVFVTVGWDESFNDELNQMWYKFVPDSIEASDFEDWRTKRSSMITSPRNCNLTWFKKGIVVPLQYRSQEEAVTIMGHLFGKDAAQYALDSGKSRWNMSLGITVNTKAEINQILAELTATGQR